MTDRILDIQNLKTYFHTQEGVIRAVDGVYLSVRRRKALGIVGESGCGKSITSLSVLQVIPSPGRIVDGRVLFYPEAESDRPVDLAQLKRHGRELRRIRGKDISLVFQEPMVALSPVYTVGNQIIEALRLHEPHSKRRARELAVEMLDKVGIPNPDVMVDRYTFELSGGMRQRALIAMALVCGPKLLIADEPTTAIDVTIQAQILDLIRSLQTDMDMSVMLITHDLGVIAEMVDDIVVMYLGKVVESGSLHDIFDRASHPYTVALQRSIPRFQRRGQPLEVIRGNVPDPYTRPQGCEFAERCPKAMNRCFQDKPAMAEVGDRHSAKCFLFTDEVESAPGREANVR